MSQMNFEKKFGQSAIFVTSTLMIEGGVPPSSSPAALLKEAIHVISCGLRLDVMPCVANHLEHSHLIFVDTSCFHHSYIKYKVLATCSWVGFMALSQKIS